MPAGQTPHTIIMFAHNDLVDGVQPGDRVTVTGIYRAMPLRANPRQRNVLSVYRTHVDVVHFRKMDTKRLYEADNSDGFVMIYNYNNNNIDGQHYSCVGRWPSG